MSIHTQVKLVTFAAVLVAIALLFLHLYTRFSRAANVKANIQIDLNRTNGILNQNWKAYAQGGEEKGRMLETVIPNILELQPKYIRLDHLTDFYDIVDRDGGGNLTFSWDKMDATVCDIYASGAKPFFSLGYMPTKMSVDGTVIGQPKNWDEWSLFVQRFIERYSGQSTLLCNGQFQGSQFTDVYYEVWNEPDLESFGKWSLYAGEKDYKTLYYYSILGANRAQNVNIFKIGGPAITAPYKNWFQVFLRYTKQNNLRIDFLSWHKYTQNPEEYATDLANVRQWLAGPEFAQYTHLPRIITEWGFDSNHNPLEESKLGAAHTVASIKQMIDNDLALAFAFELKDGQNPSWGVLRNDGTPKPRYYALKFLNALDTTRLIVKGEGTFVQGIATKSEQRITTVLVNYDKDSKNVELVPVSFSNIPPGTYEVSISNLYGLTGKDRVVITDGTLKRNILMPANMVVSIEIVKTL